MATAALPVQEAPEEQEQFGGDGFPDLDKDLQTELKALLRKALQREIYARRQEVMEARKQRFYDRGVQYIYWDFKAWGFAPLSATGYGETHEQESYEDVYNIFHPFIRAIVAGMTANVPGAHVEPRSSRTADTVGAEAADAYRQFLEQANDIKEIQTQIAYWFCTDGSVIAEVDKGEPNPRNGVGEDGEPLIAEQIRLYAKLERKCPVTQTKMKRWPYCILSEELETEYAQEEYPDAVDTEGNSTIHDSGDNQGESAYERMARIGVLQGTKLITASGETWKNLVTRHRAYFRPSFFRAASKANRDKLKEIFPKGCLLVVCGDAYCGSWDCSMDERLVVGHSTPGDGQNRPSLMHDMVGIQDSFNDGNNQQKEIFDYCIPEVYMDSASLDAMAREERPAQPGAEVPIVLAPNEDIQHKVMFGQNVEAPATLVTWLQTLSGTLAQLITGMYQVAMGAGDVHQETAKGLEILKDSALGQLGIAWGASQQLIAQAIENAIRLAASTRDASEKIRVRASDNTREDREIEIANIQNGDWYVDVDTSFPDTRAMKRAIFTQLVELSAKFPWIQQMLMLPENQKLFRDFVGIEGFEVPGAAADLRQQREIEELLELPALTPEETQLVVKEMAQHALQAMQANPGAPPPPPPTPDAIRQYVVQKAVPVDFIWDMHAQHKQAVQDWLEGQSRDDEEAKGNQNGIENVKAHGALHDQALKALAAMQPGQQKPPSVSINFKDLPPDGQIQAAAEAGIKLNPAVLAAQTAAEQQQPQGAPNA